MKKVLLLFCCFSVWFSVSAQYSDANWEGSIEPTKSFIENKSQFDDRVNLNGSEILFAYDGNGTQIYFTKNGVVYSFVKYEIEEETDAERLEELEKKGGMSAEEYKEWEREERQGKRITDVVTVEWENANPDVEVIGVHKTPDYHNYSVEGKSISNIKAYTKLLYKNIYPGIDVEYTFHPVNGLKYSFILHPGADASLISMKYPSSRNISLDEEGNIRISTLFGDITDHAPETFYAKENKSVINSRFKRNGNRVSFELDNYENTKSVIIDPWVDTPTMANSNGVWECEKDQSGNVYIIGGDMPMKLRKYSSAGALQWTYNTPWDTANYWLGTFAVDDLGNSYVTAGSVARIQKISTGGSMTWSANGGAFDEYWNIAFNCDQSKLVVGGTNTGVFPPSTSYGVIFEINTSNGSVIASQNVGKTRTTTIFGIPVTDIEEVRSISSSRNARYYYLTLDTIGAIDENLGVCPNSSTLFEEDHTYHFGYKSEFYRPNNGNSGIMSIRANGNFVYTQNGTTIHKRSLADGSILGTASIPGGINTSSQGLNQPGNSGISIDDCGNVYVGSGNAVVKYDADLNQLSSVSLPFSVFDVAVSYNGDVIVAGATGNSNSTTRTGYVQSINMSACDPLTLECCNANICPAGPFCVDDNPVTITPSTTAGTWSGPGVNPSTGLFTPATAGEGTHTIVNTLGCGSDSIQVVVEACSLLEVCMENNGDLTVTGGTGPYTWSHDTTYLDCSGCPLGNCIPPLCSGTNVTEWQTYSTNATATPHPNLPIMVIDNSGGSLEITTLSGISSCSTCPLTASITDQGNVSCYGGNDGSATVTGTNGSGNLSYSWSNNQTSAQATGLTAGTYTVTITDNNACTAISEITITEPSAELSVSLTPTQPTCGEANGSISADVSGGTSNYTYLWDHNSATTSTISDLSGGAYAITVTDANGCTTTGTIKLGNGNSPTASISNQVNVSCNGESDGTATLNITGGTPNYDVTWNTNPAQTGLTLSNVAAGDYMASITDQNNCPTSITVTITEPDAITAQTSSTNSQCGQSDGSATVTPSGGSGGFSYMWSTNPAQTGATATGLAAGTYSVTVTDANNCEYETQVAVSNNGAPSLSEQSSSIPSCNGSSDGSITVTGSGGTGNLTYSWNTIPVQTGTTATNLPAGSYTCTVIDGSGCQSGLTITLEDPAAITASPLPTDASCNGENDGYIDANATGGSGNLTYLWSTTPTQTAAIAGNLSAGTYSVTITDAEGCTTVSSATVGEPAPLVPNATVTETDCEAMTGSIQLAPTGGSGTYTYTWCNGANTATVTNLGEGDYCVTISDGNCELDTTFTITSTDYFEVNITSNGNVLTADAGVSWQWYYNGSPVSGATSQTYEITASGAYYVIATDSNGCKDDSNWLELTYSSIEEMMVHSLAVYPNPASDLVIISGDMPNGYMLEAEIYSATGQLVYKEAFNTSGQANHVQVPVYEYSDGIYLLKLMLGKEMKLERLVISR